MSVTSDSVYTLLPAIHRVRDQGEAKPLRALVEILAGQGSLVDRDIATLYENWFIETCEEWVVPYLGDLVGVKGQHPVGAAGVSARARTANVLRYRSRKGTATMLEQLARDTTGWNARVVEFFQRLGWTQQLHHQRLDNLRTPDLRRTDTLELLNGPFDQASHAVDVRRIAIDRGRYDIANVGIFLWRLQSYFLAGTTARPVTAVADGRYRFHAAGIDAPLFNRPRTETEISHLAEEINVPAPLRRRPLYDELEDRRAVLARGAVTWGVNQRALDALRGDGVPEAAIAKITPLEGQVFPTELAFTNAMTPLLTGTELTRLSSTILGRAVRGLEAQYFDEPLVLDVRVQNVANEPYLRVPPERIMVCNLLDWRRPPTTKAYESATAGVMVQRPIRLSVDPVFGRIAFPAGDVPNDVVVACATGFSGDTGGGPYSRREWLPALLDRPVSWQVGVSRELPPVANEIFATVQEAVDAWHTRPAGTMGVITLLDSRTYEESFTGTNCIRVDAGSRLVIMAAGWPEPRQAGRVEPDARRPHLIGTIEVRGAAESELAIDGVSLEGDVRVLATGAADLRRLTISHCTLMPGTSTLAVNARNQSLQVDVIRSVCGAVDLATPGTSARVFTAVESILDNRGGIALDNRGGAVVLQGCTIFGDVRALRLDADGTIITGRAIAQRRQTGCIRFSYVGPGSRTPRRFHCQPDMAVTQAPAAQQDAVRSRIVPAFTSTTWGQPAYAQLARSCPPEIRTGAEDGSEMGAFGFLRQPQREANLRSSLDEYMRIGLEAGLIFVT